MKLKPPHPKHDNPSPQEPPPLDPQQPYSMIGEIPRLLILNNLIHNVLNNHTTLYSTPKPHQVSLFLMHSYLIQQLLSRIVNLFRVSISCSEQTTQLSLKGVLS